MHKKVLNLYAGIGGNRKLWENVDVTAVENNEQIAAIYQDFFPDDKVIITDAHQYLLDHFKEFDFIWSSPPCPTHSRARFWASKGGVYKAEYPDMGLYQEIVLLQNISDSKFVVENVISYYEPLIKPRELQRHYFLANFHIANNEFNRSNVNDKTTKDFEKDFSFDLSKHDIINKYIALKNCVLPELGKHVFDCAYRKEKALRLFK